MTPRRLPRIVKGSLSRSARCDRARDDRGRDLLPGRRDAAVDSSLLDEAEVEHASAKDLIAQLQSMSADEDLYDAKVIVLGEYIDHHVKEEQNELFPACKKKQMDLAGLGRELQERKSELMLEMTGEPT